MDHGTEVEIEVANVFEQTSQVRQKFVNEGKRESKVSISRSLYACVCKYVYIYVNILIKIYVYAIISIFVHTSSTVTSLRACPSDRWTGTEIILEAGILDQTDIEKTWS